MRNPVRGSAEGMMLRMKWGKHMRGAQPKQQASIMTECSKSYNNRSSYLMIWNYHRFCLNRFFLALLKHIASLENRLQDVDLLHDSTLTCTTSSVLQLYCTLIV